MSISSTVVHRAAIEFHEAADVLRPYVGCFWIVTAEQDAAIRVVPDGSAAISIQLENGRSFGWMLRGPLVQPDERRFASAATLVGVRLRPGVAFILSRIPAYTTVGRRIDVSAVPEFDSLVTQRFEQQTPVQYVDALQRFLIERLQNASVHGVVAQAIREIEREQGCLTIADVAARCHVSPRHLNRLTRDWIGYGAKVFASVVRFQATLNQIDHTPDRSPADLAADNGYFDQSHLTLDLGRFAGATPRRLASTSVADFSKTRCDDSL